MNNLLSIKKNQIYLSTDILAEKLGRQHRIIKNLVRNYKKELEILGVLHFENVPNKYNYGKPLQVYYLNEKQYIFLITNMRTKANEFDTVMKAKIEIADRFVEMEKMILQLKVNKQNEEWIKTRKEGKKARKDFTDILKELLELTKENNPDSTYVKKPNLLYSNFIKMIYKNLYDIEIKTKNLRDSLSKKQLSILGVAELAALRSIQKEINNNKDVKEIYKITNKIINKYSEIVGKSTIIDLINNNQITINDLLDSQEQAK